MTMFSSIQSKIILAQLALFVIIMGVGYWYWSYSQNRIETLAAERAQLQTAVQTQQNTITALERHQRATAERMHTLQTDLAQADRGRRELEARVRRLNLQMMARTDAVNLERRINESTHDVFSDLERLTGGGGTTSTTNGRSTTPQPHAHAPTATPMPRPPVRGTTNR